MLSHYITVDKFVDKTHINDFLWGRDESNVCSRAGVRDGGVEMLDQVVSNDDLRSLQAVGPWFDYAVNQ